MSLLFVASMAILLGLGLLLVREFRRPLAAEGSHWKKRLRISLVAIPLLLGCLAFWAFLIEPNRLVIHHETIAIDMWPKELDGLKIAVISDLHVGGSFIDLKKVRLIVERTNQLQPDMIVILGDYMSGQGWTSNRVDPAVFAGVLKDLHAPFSVYSVLGNHDWWWNGPRVRDGLETNGIRVLEDEVLEVKVRGRSVWLAGLADLWTRPQHIDETIAKIPPGAAVIALTHNPDIFPQLPQRVQLLLAGHTHGGQVRLPIVGTIIQPSNYGERYVRGHVFEKNHHLFVTTGIGTSIIPVRLGVPPEIVLLTIKTQ
ncbi:MAG: metallophosphoesterase [bacterium]